MLAFQIKFILDSSSTYLKIYRYLYNLLKWKSKKSTVSKPNNKPKNIKSQAHNNKALLVARAYIGV